MDYYAVAIPGLLLHCEGLGQNNHTIQALHKGQDRVDTKIQGNNINEYIYLKTIKTFKGPEGVFHKLIPRGSTMGVR